MTDIAGIIFNILTWITEHLGTILLLILLGLFAYKFYLWYKERKKDKAKNPLFLAFM